MQGPRQFLVGDVADVALAGEQRLHALDGRLEADHSESDLDGSHRHRQAHIALPDHHHLRRAVIDLLDGLVGVHRAPGWLMSCRVMVMA